MPFTHYRTRGFIIRKEDKGETDQILSVFTEDFGKLQILGKGIRKITSKLRPAADLFYLSEIEFIQGKNYKTLTDAILLKKFKNISQSLEKFEIVLKIAEAIDLLTSQEEKDEKIWNLAVLIFREIENLEIENYKLKIIYFYFLWNLFAILGYEPELYNCPICNRKLLPETFYFIASQGGIVCWRCLGQLIKSEQLSESIKENRKNIKESIGAKEIKIDTVKILRILLKNDWLTAKKLKISETNNLWEISERYFSYLKSELSKKQD